MANKNIGIGVDSTIVPLYDDMTHPVVNVNDARGGVHYISTKSAGPPGDPSPKFFWQISPLRREIGMLVYVGDEDRYYQLTHKNQGTFDNTDPENFEILEIGGSGTEWLYSVKGLYNDPSLIPTADKKDGNRFLVGQNPTSGDSFEGKKNRIATYVVNASNSFGGGFEFEIPSDGTTLRIDNRPHDIYKFSGTSSDSGNWYKEIQNIVRYISPTSDNGLTYSYTTNEQTPLTGYTYCVFIASFATANAGSASLSIDGSQYASIKKVSSNSLVELSANDVAYGIQYQLTFNSGTFQISLPGAGSGGTIGPAEDGDYDDGLYTDFDENTPIGTPIDRFNQILKALVPPSAPNLSSWSVDNQTVFVEGKISYTDAYATGTLGYVTTDTSPYTDVGRGDTYQKGSNGGYRLGITDDTGIISGKLNSAVVQNSNLPVPAYATYSIGNGITGSIAIYINSKTASIVDLGSTLGAVSDSTAHGSLTLTAATNSKFSNGSPFENFWWRTGVYTVDRGSSFMNGGFNQIQVKHLLTTTTYTLTSYEFLIDDSILTTTLTPQTTVYQLSTPRYLSGIGYYTNGYITYTVTATNMYRNTYYSGTDAGTFLEASTQALSTSPIYNGVTKNTRSAFNVFTPTPGTQALGTPTDVTSSASFTTDFYIASGMRKINGGTIFKMTAKRTVQDTVTDGVVTVNNLFIDTVTTAASNLEENFNTEGFRIPNSTGYNTVTQVTSATWVSTNSLLTQYTNELQVADGRLLYPSYDFTGVSQAQGSLSTNPNYGASFVATRDYRTCKDNVSGAIHGGALGNYRTYTRYFYFGTTSYPKFSFNITYDNCSFVPLGTDLNTGTSRCYIEFKLPYQSSAPLPDGGLVSGGSVTGWLDASTDFDGKLTPTDGRGCKEGSIPSGGLGWKINFGGRNTSSSGGYVLMRITVGKTWTGHIQNITITPG